MKKFKAILLIILFLVALTISSCKSTRRCTAYGEIRKFQIDNPY